MSQEGGCLSRRTARLQRQKQTRSSELGRDGTSWMWRGDAGEPPTLAEPGTAVCVSKIRRSMDWNWVFYKIYYKIWIGILKHLWIGFQQWFSSIFQLLHGHSSGPARAQSNPWPQPLCCVLTLHLSHLIICQKLWVTCESHKRYGTTVTSRYFPSLLRLVDPSVGNRIIVGCSVTWQKSDGFLLEFWGFVMFCHVLS